MLKLESPHKSGFLKNQDSSLGLPWSDLPSKTRGICIGIVTIDVATHNADVAERITHVVGLQEEYNDVGEVLSPLSIFNPKNFAGPETPGAKFLSIPCYLKTFFCSHLLNSTIYVTTNVIENISTIMINANISVMIFILTWRRIKVTLLLPYRLLEPNMAL